MASGLKKTDPIPPRSDTTNPAKMTALILAKAPAPLYAIRNRMNSVRLEQPMHSQPVVSVHAR